MLTGTLRGNFDNHTALAAAGTAVIANFVLDIVLVFGFHWGVVRATCPHFLTLPALCLLDEAFI